MDSVQRTRHSPPVNKDGCNVWKRIFLKFTGLPFKLEVRRGWNGTQTAVQFELRDMPGPWCSRKSPCFQILLWTFKFELVESVIGHSRAAMGMTNVGLIVLHCVSSIFESNSAHGELIIALQF